ncbi:MAG TPA: hypothetical protein VFY67_14090 [Pyrinomonadaceae bacterium]|nr:hypothetical protein [Pyrinomonadaceae bacterium]
MRFSLKPRWRFVAKAVIQEFRQSRLYKMVVIFTTCWFVLNFLSLFGFDLPIPSFSWRTVALILSSLVLALLLVVEAIYRFHRRTVSAMYDDKQKAVWIVMKLTEVAGMATQIDRLYRDKEDEAPKEIFQNWVGALRTALQDLSPSAVSDFTNGHPEELDTVPDSRHVWFLFLRERLSKWIGHQTTLVKQAKADHEQLHS